MERSKQFLLLLVIALCLSSCKNDKKVVTPLDISFKKHGELTVYKTKTDSVLAHFDIEIADDAYETQTGLMNRYAMNDNEAMLFIFPDIQPRSFYMKNTYIPLDIIYLDQNGKIVSFQKNTTPLNETSLPSNYPAKFVLEIKAGLSDRFNLKIGDSIAFSLQ